MLMPLKLQNSFTCFIIFTYLFWPETVQTKIEVLMFIINFIFPYLKLSKMFDLP